MRALSIVGFTATALIALSLHAAPAQACSCAPPPDAATAFEGAKFVFEGVAGEATGPDLEPDGTTSNVSPKSVTFKVLRSWKGGLVGDAYVKTATSSAACGRNYEVGQNYLVYAGADDAGEPYDTICTRTRTSKRGAEDVAVLDGLGEGPSDTVSEAPGDSAKAPPTTDAKDAEAGAEGTADAATDGAEATEGTEATGEGDAGTGETDATPDAGAAEPVDAAAGSESTETKPADAEPTDTEEPGCSMASAGTSGFLAFLPLAAITRRRR